MREEGCYRKRVCSPIECQEGKEAVVKRRDADPFEISVNYIGAVEILQTLSRPVQLFVAF